MFRNSYRYVSDLHCNFFDDEVPLGSTVDSKYSVDQVVIGDPCMSVVLLRGEHYRRHQLIWVVLVDLHESQSQLVGIHRSGSLIQEFKVLEVAIHKLVWSSYSFVVQNEADADATDIELRKQLQSILHRLLRFTLDGDDSRILAVAKLVQKFQV